MTQKKQPQERAGLQRYQALVQSLQVERQPQGKSDEKVDRALPMASRSTRVVSTPPIVQPTSWNVLADRRATLRRRNVKSHTYTALVPRTFAQTGVSASTGQLRAIKRAHLRRAGSPVPVRSGQHVRRRNVFMRILAFLFMGVLVVVSLNFVLTNSVFQVEQVSVAGTSDSALIQEIQHLGMQGQNIFMADTNGWTSRVAALPMVESVSLGKQWPNRIQITVVERTPVLLWQTRQGVFSVDKQGIVIAPVSVANGNNHLMTVVDQSGQGVIGGNAEGVGQQTKPVQPGVRLNGADVQFAEEVFTALPRMTGISVFTLRYADTLPGGGSGVSGPAQGGDRSFVIQSPQGWSAYLGNAENENPLDNRLVELQQILVYAQKQQLNLATIDLRFGLRPVYTLKN